MEIKRNYHKSWLLSLLLILSHVLVLPIEGAHAETKPTNMVGFNYNIEYPSNQLGEDKGYFDLLMEAGQQQTVNIVLSNPSKEKVTVNVLLNGAKTNSNGVVEYGPTKLEDDTSLKYRFEDVVSVPKSVELAAGAVKNLEVAIKMPKTTFPGIILGGIQLKAADQVNESAGEGGATVKNEYAYVIAMVLKNDEAVLDPEVKINRAYASQDNFRNTIGINVSNIAATLVSDKMSVESQVMKKGSEEVLYERKQTGMSFAPNTYLNFPISMNGEAMVPGEYTADVLVTIDDKKWQDSVEFTITKEDADKYNKRDVGLVQDRGLDWKIVGLIVGGVLGLVIVIFVIVKMIQNKKKEAQKVTAKKSGSKKGSSKRRRG